jgi:hypothetical protein
LNPLRWSTYHRNGSLQQQHNQIRSFCTIFFAKSPNEDEDAEKALGMAEAFRQLEALDSLDDPEEYVPAPAKIHVVDVNISSSSSSSSSSISPEQDFVLYKDMVQELEDNQVAVAYSEVLEELGGSSLQTNDTYSQVITELGGAFVMKQRPKDATIPKTPDTIGDDVNLISPRQTTSDVTSEQILEDALKEALADVQLNNPRISDTSILDEKEIMREIEAVFDQGNAKLLESLEEVRREQVGLCAAFMCR